MIKKVTIPDGEDQRNAVVAWCEKNGLLAVWTTNIFVDTTRRTIYATQVVSENPEDTFPIGLTVSILHGNGFGPIGSPGFNFDDAVGRCEELMVMRTLPLVSEPPAAICYA